MVYQYVTTDTSGLKKFRGLGTGREVLVNADPEDRIVLLRKPSNKEIIQIIAEYNSRRITYWWDNSVAVVGAQKRRHGHQPHHPFAQGFLTSSWKENDRDVIKFQHLKFSAVKPYLPEYTSTEIVDHCLSLSVDEQLKLLRSLRPANVDELLKIVPMNVVPRAIHVDFLKCYRLCDDLISFVNTLIQLLKGESGEFAKEIRLGWSPRPFSPRILELLGYLNQQNWILLNKRALLSLTASREHNFKISHTLGERTYWNDESVALVQGVTEEYNRAGYAVPSDAARVYKRLCLLLRASSIETIGDISPELLTFNESCLEILPLSRDSRKIIRHLTDALVRFYKKDERYSREFPVINRTPIGRDGKRKPEHLLRTRGFRWVLETRPEFIKWVGLFEEYADSLRLQSADHFFSQLNRWLDYMAGLESPPLTPEEVSRDKHIRNVWNQSVKTYWKYLDDHAINDHGKNGSLMVMRRFFDFYNDKLMLSCGAHPDLTYQFHNPIRTEDGWNYKNQRKSYRYALGAELVELILEIILDRDEHGTPTYTWAKTHPAFRRDWLHEVDHATKDTTQVWWPGRTIAMYMLLVLPLRSFQVRWLDEGVADEYVYDFDKRCLVPNLHPSAQRGRQEGVLRLVQDPFHDTSFLGLWINTNKTGLYDPTTTHGYEIPWPNDELFRSLRVMIDWNKRYFPNPQPVTVADDDEAVTTKSVIPLLPKFFPLFRDRSGYTRRNPNLPMKYEKLSRMWSHLLAEAERRLKARGKTIELVEWMTREGGSGHSYKTPRAKFDLHSLRVSGITSLIERGVPIHIVSEYIAGHSTILMTLYYEKTSPLKVREMLLQAQRNVRDDLDGCLSLLHRIEDPESILVWNNLGHNDSALEALKAHRGLWQVGADGICPGTICEEGGPLDASGKATSVPTGACGMCRFFITGPAFLYGQMQKINNLMYSIREQGEELRSVRVQEIDLEDGGDRRSLSDSSGRRERIERELKDLTYEWCNRYRMFQASMSMLDEYRKKMKHTEGTKSLLPLLSANSADGFKTVVDEATNVGLVRQISLMHEVLGNFDLHKGPLLEYEEILNTILVDNGFEALLLTIPREKRVAAANMLGEFLINSIGDDAIDNLISGGDKLPLKLHEPTRRLLEYLKSDKFVLTPPIAGSESHAPRKLVQITGSKA